MPTCTQYYSVLPSQRTRNPTLDLHHLDLQDAKHGFRFGSGLYFAEDLSKSLSYDPWITDVGWEGFCPRPTLLKAETQDGGTIF